MTPTDPPPPGGSRSLLSFRLPFPLDALRKRFAREPAAVSEQDVPAIRRRLGLDPG